VASKRESLIASAEKSLGKGRIESALTDYMKVLDEVPGDVGILNKVGDLLVRLNRNDESIPYFNRIAEHYAHDGFHVKAIAMYKKVNRLDPAKLEVYERLAELYSKQGLAQEAKSQYQVLADHYLKQDNTGGAVAIFQKMVQADPGNIQLHVKMADLFTQVRRVPDALKEYAIVAGMLRDRSAHAEAVQVYEKALKLAPDNVEILRSLVPLLVETGNAAGARNALRRALETTPRSVPLFVMAAEAALAANDLTDARNWATKAQAVDPENEEVLNAVVKVHMKARRPDLAVPAAASLAELCVRRGEVKKALALLVPIAKVAPENMDLLRKIVDISVKAGDEVFTVPYRSAIAEVYRRDGMTAEAAEQLRVCSRLAPDHAEFRTRLAALEPLLAPPAAGAPALRREIPVHDRAMTIPGDMLRPVADGPSAPPPPAVEPAVPAAEEPGPAAPERDEFEFDLGDESLGGPSQPAPQPAQVPEPSLPEPARPATRAAEPPPVWDVVEPIEDALEILEDEGPPPAPAPRPWQELPTAEDLEFAGSVAGPVPVPLSPGPPVPLPRAAVNPLEALAAMEELDRMPSDGAPVSPPLALLPKDAEELSVDEALVEADVFRKYGLLEKAVEKLRPLVRDYPSNVRCREKLFELLIEQGKVRAARREAEALKAVYEGAGGRLDRVRAMEDLLGESLDVPSRPAPAPKIDIPDFSGTPPFKPVRPLTARDIEIPLGHEPVTPSRAHRPRAASSLDQGLAQLDQMVRAGIRPAPTPTPTPLPQSRSVDQLLTPASQPTLPIRPSAPPVAVPKPASRPSPEELGEVDFCLEQGMSVDAAERLHTLEARYPGDAALAVRRDRLEGAKGAGDESRPILQDLLAEDLESVLDAELGRALTDEMQRGAVSMPGLDATRATQSNLHVDESALFSDEQEFFNLAEELQAEMKPEGLPEEPVMDQGSAGVSLEAIFREFKKGVEQQLSPEDHETHYNLGIAYKEMGLTDEAIGEFQVAAKDPQHAVECCSMLGLCFLEKGLPQLAIKWYNKGLETPGIREEERLGLQYDLGSLFFELGDREAAYRTFLEIYGTNASFRDVGDRLKELQAV
jgi:tetratricopeptide (TPR) repeat protein